MKSKISVIVPIYKVERYLEACIQSILEQTYQNLEIILVDDGSPDRCGEIADRYARMDARIQVIHQENGGLADARNTGIAVATGEYLSFVDSDDCVHPQMMELLLQAAGDGQEDVVISSYQRIAEEQKVIQRDKLSLPDVERLDGKTLQREYLKASDRRLIMTVAWGKLYRRGCFQRIRYPKGKCHEDEYVTFQILYEAERIVWIDVPLYDYRTRENSIMGQFDARRFDVFGGYQRRMQYYMEQQERELAKDTFFLAIHMLAQYRAWMERQDTLKCKTLEGIQLSLCQYARVCSKEWSLTGSEKLEMSLFFHQFSIYYWLWKWNKK